MTMNSLIKRIRPLLIPFAVVVVFVSSLVLGMHNATLYNPRHGFDGADHLFYIKYVNKFWKLPPITILRETHQSPIYYFIGAVLMAVTGTWKTAQYINTFILWLIIGMVGLGLWKVFKKRDQVLIGMFSLAALPMLNIFPAMITNELLNTLWIISSAVVILFVISSKHGKDLFISSLLFTICFILGYWTKISIILIIPGFLASYIYLFIKKTQFRKKILLFLFLIVMTIGLSISPIVLRARTSYSASDTTKISLINWSADNKSNFYTRLDWIWNIDMYNTQYYSFTGAAWNSFWTDGHNAITPFIKFHKKSFVLWSLGFVLFPICVYGLFLFSKHYKKYALVINVILATMLLTYFYTFRSISHYSAGRLTYEMGIIIPYAFGIASVAKSKKIKILLLFLFSIQFAVMVSFYWILPWWHVTK